jgi:hypothetical protein
VELPVEVLEAQGAEFLDFNENSVQPFVRVSDFGTAPVDHGQRGWPVRFPVRFQPVPGGTAGFQERVDAELDLVGGIDIALR